MHFARGPTNTCVVPVHRILLLFYRARGIRLDVCNVCMRAHAFSHLHSEKILVDIDLFDMAVIADLRGSQIDRCPVLQATFSY